MTTRLPVSMKGTESAQKALRLLESGPWGRVLRNIITWIDSCLFPCSFLLAGPGQQRLFELTRRPLLAQAVSSSSAETTENLVVVRWKSQNMSFSPDYSWILVSFRRWRRNGMFQRRVLSQLKKPFIGEAGKEEGARKLTRLDSSIPIYNYIFYG